MTDEQVEPKKPDLDAMRSSVNGPKTENPDEIKARAFDFDKMFPYYGCWLGAAGIVLCIVLFKLDWVHWTGLAIPMFILALVVLIRRWKITKKEQRPFWLIIPTVLAGVLLVWFLWQVEHYQPPSEYEYYYQEYNDGSDPVEMDPGGEYQDDPDGDGTRVPSIEPH